MQTVIVPVAGGTAGFLATRYLGNMAAMKDWGTTDAKLAKTGAAVAMLPLTFFASRYLPMVARNSGAIVLGAGLAAAESWLRDTPLLGGSPAAAVVTGNGNGNGMMPGEAPPSMAPGEETVVENGDGLSSYYDFPVNAQGQALSDDYYTAGMLGNADPANQAEVEGAMDSVEAISTVTPTDLALRARTMPQVARVRERFVNRGDRGHAGGMFARNLFSGMMGS